MILNLSSRDRRALTLGLAALALLALGRFVLLPWMDSWLAARDQIADGQSLTRDTELRLARYLGRRSRLEAIYGPSVSNELQDVQTAKMSLFQAVQDTAIASGISPDGGYTWQSIKPLKDLPGVKLVPLEVRGKCNQQQLTKCLASLRNSRTVLLVEKLSATGDDKGSGKLSVRMVLSTLARDGGKS